MENIYHPDIFYEINDLTLDQKKEICKEAKELSFKWWTDKLVSIKREKIEVDFDKVLNLLTPQSHFVVIHRKGYDKWKDKEWFEQNWCLEIGFNEGVFYLWILVDQKKVPYFVEKYKLKPMGGE